MNEHSLPRSVESRPPAPSVETSGGGTRALWLALPFRERMTIAFLALLSLALRGIELVRYRIDSDEPQHLHVAWGWTAGMVQYRDVFDNHAPLFHMLTAPILKLVGERPDVMFFMRLPMLPLFALVIAATYICGRRLYSFRSAIWAAVILSLYPPFFFKSLEYRTDNLWNAFWALTLIVLTGGPLTPLRIFVAGFLLGVGMCVSLKTMLIVFTLAICALVTWLFCGGERSWRRVALVILPALAGMVIMPTIIVTYFRVIGAWPDLVYCTMTFNHHVSRTRGHLWIWRALYPFALGAVLYLAWRWSRGRTFDRVTRWRFFFGLTIAVYATTLLGFWILISTRDFLAMMPIAAFAGIGALELRPDARPRLWALLTILATIMLISIADQSRLFENRADEYTTMMNQALGLTRPGEPIMDMKGETIYRRRVFYYPFEIITRAQLRAGIIQDTIPEDVVRANCHVAQADGDFLPDRARAFLSHNFLDLGRLRASGQWVAAQSGTFSIAIPGKYIILTEKGPAAGSLDGTPIAGPRELAVGLHHFQPADPGLRAACLWAPAYERGYSPFHLRDRDF
jgi:Dolichyl-phosphate-mannose-protein mannosyltransferase